MVSSLGNEMPRREEDAGKLLVPNQSTSESEVDDKKGTPKWAVVWSCGGLDLERHSRHTRYLIGTFRESRPKEEPQ